MYAYRPDARADEEIIAVLQEPAERFPERGFSKYFKVIRRRGYVWNHKRVYRIYCALHLNHRLIGKKRLPPRTPAPLAVPGQMNQSWSINRLDYSTPDEVPMRPLRKAGVASIQQTAE